MDLSVWDLKILGFSCDVLCLLNSNEYTPEKQDILLHTGIILIVDKAEFELKTWTLTTW